jgi:thiol-disulfide isomerase/thioredoxin
MSKIVIGVGVGAVVLAGGWYLFSMQSREAAVMAQKEMEAQAMMEEEAMKKAQMEEAAMMKDDMVKTESEMMKDDAMMETGSDAMMKKDESAMADESVMTKAGLYAPYEASKLAMASSGDVVLFFKAAWCPSCRALDAHIKANLEAIPADLTILEVDYDTATALRQQYGVTTQHTLVHVDASGQMLKKWSGGATLESIVAQVQ